jgi:predicted adenine nucleotide alpha hydrolase (AANH) superfamily ATPase
MKIVVHICCGICAAGVVKNLSDEGHTVVGFFYNPNIHPEKEYLRRLETTRKVARELCFPLIAAPYMPEEWFVRADPLMYEPEGGKRCEVCYEMRLAKTYQYVLEYGIDAFTTTLTISPRKRAETVNRIGLEIGGDAFLARDFKKKDGFNKANQLARRWGLYRQNYCGCVYSMRSGGKQMRAVQPGRSSEETG